MTKRTDVDPWQTLEYESQKRSTLEGLIALAAQGDRESALKVLSIARGYLRGPSVLARMPEELRQHLDHCFSLICSEKATADQALGLKKRTKGRSANYWTAVRDADVARGVEYYRQQGLNRNEAIDKVAESYTAFLGKTGNIEVDADTVRKAYDRHFPKRKK